MYTEILLKLVPTFFGSLFAFLTAMLMFIIKRKKDLADQHVEAVRKLYLALARVGHADFQIVGASGCEQWHTDDKFREALEARAQIAKQALDHALTRYTETWHGDDDEISVPRRVQVMCSYALRPVFAHGLGSSNPAELTDHIIEHLKSYYPQITHLSPTWDDSKAVRTLLNDDMGGAP